MRGFFLHLTLTTGCLLFLLAGWTGAQAKTDPPAASPPPALAAETPPAPSLEAPAGNSLAALKERIEQYWQHKSKDELDQCYAMLSQASREQYSLMQFIRMSNIKYSSYDLTEISLEPSRLDFARVVVSCRGQALGYELNNVQVKQSWLFEEGEWCYAFAKTNPFQAQSEEEGASRNQKKEINPELLEKMREMMAKYRRDFQPGQSAAERIETGTGRKPDILPNGSSLSPDTEKQQNTDPNKTNGKSRNLSKSDKYKYMINKNNPPTRKKIALPKEADKAGTEKKEESSTKEKSGTNESEKK
ncbi:MAG: hypothetical protein JXQ27_18070 [Acidobacteria bacterium]|nr:hypothetical protein [Acidobacteriota bacterium]